MLFMDTGKSIRFNESSVRSMGRTARGVRGIRMDEGQSVISLIICKEGHVLTVTENGYGKRTALENYPVQGRSGQGVISIQTSERNGKVVGATLVSPGQEVMLISNGGTLVRTRVDEISITGRNTQGVRLINLDSDEHLVSVERIEEQEDAGDGDVAVEELPAE
jgi:DNA gyrase subunit A